MRKSLCDPETERFCQNPWTAFAESAPHTSLNCYVRYLDLGFEPGETCQTFDEWARN